MPNHLRFASGLALLLVAAPACSGSVTDTTDTTTTVTTGTTTDTSTTGTSTSTTTFNPGEWTTLIDGTWELPGGTEAYWCARKTIQQDTYVKAFRAQAPPGTHHTLLIQEKGGQPDGEFPCGATLGADMLHASGVGTDDLVFPDGVAVKVAAGTQLMLNLHLFNVTNAPISGVSGTLVQTVPASEVKAVAQMELGGTLNISVPPNGSQTVEGVCTFPTATTLSTVWPHMHQYGTHMKVTYQGASGTKVLHDAPYSFGDQKNHMLEPLAIAAGDIVRIQCTYANPTSQTINWGDSSNAEMCFAGLYTYPPLVPGIQCQ